MVGRSIYPLNSRRLKELCDTTRMGIERNLAKTGGRTHWTFQRYAFCVMQSLIIRLLVRIPLRQRNIREMLWAPTSFEQGRNLYKRNGEWRLIFRGNELKIPEVRGEEHVISYAFPHDLVELLEEWLLRWRPILISDPTSKLIGQHRSANQQQFVFTDFLGRPLQPRQVTELVERATFKFTGVSVNPHTFRNIFATEYIKGTNNFIDAAYMLGDSVKTVIDTYVKLLDEDCAKRASDWVTQTLSGEMTNKNRNGDHSQLAVLKYPRARYVATPISPMISHP